MGNFQAVIDNLLRNWNEAAPAARIGILLLASICITAIIGVGYWSVQPTYVTLISDADHDKMDRVIDALDKANIDYDLSGAGGNLRVNKNDYSRARMLARGAGVDANEVAGLGMGGAFSSPTDRNRAALLQKQQRLATTIEKLKFIDQANVHLNVPDRGPFDRNTSQPTASVMVTVMPGYQMSNQQASSIASIVAFAVEDMEPQAVQITDKEGNSYSVAEDSINGISNQISYTAEAERKLARKAETQLIHFLGHGNASVQVSLDLTFTNGSKIITEYDPESKVATQEDLINESSTKARQQANGAAGVNANLEPAPTGGSEQGVESKTENIKTTYLVSKTEETQSNSTPIRNFMTVSVLVNSGAENLKSENGDLIAGIQEKVTSIVQNAVGFQPDTDTISVELLPFPSSLLEVEPMVAPYDWSQWSDLARNASLAIGALVALLIGWMTLKKVDLAPQPPQPVAQLDDERNESIAQLGKLLEKNPDVFAEILQNWSEIAPNQTPEQGSRAA